MTSKAGRILNRAQSLVSTTLGGLYEDGDDKVCSMQLHCKTGCNGNRKCDGYSTHPFGFNCTLLHVLSFRFNKSGYLNPQLIAFYALSV